MFCAKYTYSVALVVMLVNSWSVAQDVLIDTSTTDEACNTVDASARSIIEQYLGPEVGIIVTDVVGYIGSVVTMS